MAKIGDPKDSRRVGSVRKRSQVKNPVTDLWVKRDDTTGVFVDVKTTGGKFKGVRREDLVAAHKASTRRAALKASTRKVSKKVAKKASKKKSARRRL